MKCPGWSQFEDGAPATGPTRSGGAIKRSCAIENQIRRGIPAVERLTGKCAPEIVQHGFGPGVPRAECQFKSVPYPYWPCP
jgi:hypothetical protein